MVNAPQNGGDRPSRITFAETPSYSNEGGGTLKATVSVGGKNYSVIIRNGGDEAAAREYLLNNIAGSMALALAYGVGNPRASTTKVAIGGDVLTQYKNDGTTKRTAISDAKTGLLNRIAQISNKIVGYATDPEKKVKWEDKDRAAIAAMGILENNVIGGEEAPPLSQRVGEGEETIPLLQDEGGGGPDVAAPAVGEADALEEDFVFVDRGDLTVDTIERLPTSLLDAVSSAEGIAYMPNNRAVSYVVGDSHRTTLQHFYNDLERLYGDCGARAVQQMKRNHPKDASRPLTAGKVREAFIAVATDVREEDLRRLFDTIRHGGEGPAVAGSVSNDVRNYLQRFDSFEELGPNEVGLLLEPFRLADSAKLFPTTDEFATTGSWSKRSKDNLELPRDIERAALVDAAIINTEGEAVSLFTPEEKHNVAVSEHLGKNISHFDLKVGMVIPIKTSTSPFGDTSYFKVHSALEDQKRGYSNYILIPLNSQCGDSADGSQDVHIVFRGTDSLEGLYEDLDQKGVGKRRFDANNSAFIRNVDRAVEEASRQGNRKVNINIAGHSLGGCDAQRALVSVVHEINVRRLRKEHYNSIESINMIAHNAPRPESALQVAFNRVLVDAKARDHTIPIGIHYVLYENESGDEDVVSLMGTYGASYIDDKVGYPLHRRDIMVTLPAQKSEGPRPMQLVSSFVNRIALHRFRAFTYSSEEGAVLNIRELTPAERVARENTKFARMPKVAQQTIQVAARQLARIPKTIFPKKTSIDIEPSTAA